MSQAKVSIIIPCYNKGRLYRAHAFICLCPALELDTAYLGK